MALLGAVGVLALTHLRPELALALALVPPLPELANSRRESLAGTPQLSSP